MIYAVGHDSDHTAHRNNLVRTYAAHMCHLKFLGFQHSKSDARIVLLGVVKVDPIFSLRLLIYIINALVYGTRNGIY